MGEPLREPQDPPTTDRGYEHSDVAIRPLVIFLAGLTLSLIVVSGIVAALFFLFESEAEEVDPVPSPLAQANQPIPGPILQVMPKQDLNEFRDREQRQLDATEWIDQPRGIARIPLEHAMDLTAKNGLPNWPAMPTEGAAQP
ncbi:MAG: hypothetical protein H0T51_26905 [Pirellulales bacterium]|nr:hypothetical protein [Pirellulales bacterium]